MMLKSDDAVSPVVAMMLVLAVVAICVSVMFATYVPDLKENAEILHSKEVKEEFFKFASDVDTIFANGRSGVYSYIIPLGGGDTLFSPSKSAGTIEIEDNQIGTVIINGEEYPINLVSVSYTPLLSFWENQGYAYENGTVYVTKETVSVSALEGESDATDTLFTWMRPNLTRSYNDSDNIWHDFYAMNIVSVETGESAYTSGNGDAVLKITPEKETKRYDPLNSLIIKKGDTVLYEYPGGPDSELTITKITAKVSVT